jgi:anaerobic magnesium-protoporphyrin IX monomethyl ester cyclase
MRILLVNPPYHGFFTLFGLRIPPLGLAYLGASVREAGHEVRIADLNVARAGEKEDFSGWDVVGITTDTTRARRARDIARRAKAAGATVVLGGPHPTTADAEVMREPAVDYVVRSEGETTLVELLGALGEGGDPARIAGLTYRRRGKIVRTPDRPFLRDVDALLPPARDLLHMDRYSSAQLGERTLSPVVTSRGCPFRCSFCASSFMNGPKWRPHSPRRVVDEVEEVHRRWGYGAVAFSDDNSLMDPRRASAIAAEIRRRKLDVYLWAFCRADTAARHPGMIEEMAGAGLRSVFMGVESPTRTGLSSINKNIAPGDVLEAIRIFRRNGIQILGSYIIGLEDDTLGSIRETLRMARKLDTNTAQFSILTPYPGTRIYENLRHRITRRDWSLYDGNHLVFRHRNLSRLQLELSVGLCYLAFYFRSLKSLLGFLRFLWIRRRGLGSVKETANDVIFAS